MVTLLVVSLSFMDTLFSPVCVGFCEADGDDRYNAAVCLTGAGVLGRHRKVHLPAAEGVVYREFMLDVDEGNNVRQTLSLDKLQIWQEEAGNLTGFTPGAGFAGSHTNSLVYNLDAGGDHWVLLNAGMSHGSGQSDVRLLIPNSEFINDTAHRYVTLYSSFGEQGGLSSSDAGFEEWGLHNAVSPVLYRYPMMKTHIPRGQRHSDYIRKLLPLKVL